MKISLSLGNKIAGALLLFVGLTASTYAQESESPLASDPLIEGIHSDLQSIKKLKISGYVQAQYQVADTAGAASMAGGDFTGLDNRFKVRRGRVKMAYASGLSKAVLQIDITEKGVGLNEAYVTLGKTYGVTAGIFDRPFGNEIAYSSSSIESLERSRITQTLFPGEKDLGAQLTLQAPKTSSFHFIKLEAGLFNGNGPAVETDSYKDFIGHLSMAKTSMNEKSKWGLGASYYAGGFAAATATQYTMKNKSFVAETIEKGDKLGREYFGVDGQFAYDGSLGMTQIRAEYIMGTQNATHTKTTSPKAPMSGDAYQRNFSGYYVYFIQNIMESPFQAVVKYDVYDPNTNVSGNEIGLGGTDKGDIKYSTVGFGLHYRYDSHTKISAYYDMVTNETTDKITSASTLSNLSKDKNDNVFTLRLQYKF